MVEGTVVIDGEHALYTDFITHGVFQESVLGPLLFIILSTVDIHADDTCKTLATSAAASNLPVVVLQRLQEDIIPFHK